MSAHCWLPGTFSAVAIVASAIHGYFAVEIFTPNVAPHYIRKAPAASPPTPSALVVKPLSWHVHQFFLNFCGSLVGWIALWFVGQKLLCAFHGDPSDITWDITWPNAGISLVAFFGVTGYLPAATVGLIKGLARFIAEKAGD
jgi:hypothetical protein